LTVYRFCWDAVVKVHVPLTRLKLKSGNFKTRKVSATDWNAPTKAEQWRAAWAESVNAALEQHGHTERIDHRSYQRQGIDQIPTIHRGVAATQMERRGIVTERGNQNRIIEISNKELRQTKARIDKLNEWLKGEEKATAPTLSDVLADILKGGEDKTRYAKIRDLKAAAQVLNYLQENNIATLPQLQERVSGFYGRLSDVRERLKPVERRLKTLDEHIKQAGVIAKHGALYKRYKAQKPKNREAFCEAHRAEITLYETATRYMKEHLNGRTTIPLKAWQAEHVRLTAEKSALSADYRTLKDEIREVETIRRHAEDMERAMEQKQMAKSRETEI
jgi:hypothetical protein